MPLGGKPKSVKPPAIQPSPPTTVQVSERAQSAGQAERMRLRRAQGTTANILTRPDRLGVATVQRQGLKSVLG